MKRVAFMFAILLIPMGAVAGYAEEKQPAEPETAKAEPDAPKRMTIDAGLINQIANLFNSPAALQKATTMDLARILTAIQRDLKPVPVCPTEKPKEKIEKKE
jgi:hypothetical protein